MKERSLIAFTLLAQTSVGAVWTLITVRAALVRQFGTPAADAALSAPTIVSVPIMLAALIASLFHLGTPRNAWRALANLRSSWLSREIACAVAFAASLALLAGLTVWGLSPMAREALIWLTGLVGLALVLSMANAYRLRTIPAWDTELTLASFAMTALTLGGLTVGVVLALDPHPAQVTRYAMGWVAVSTTIWLGIQLVTVVLWLAQMSAGPQAAQAARQSIESHPRLIRARIGLAMLALVISGTALASIWTWVNAGSLILTSFALAAASEVIGRLLFYQVRIRSGV
jgi:anaerobic dimethyl sulfoxide reductase subunit C (anchor subunit)